MSRQIIQDALNGIRDEFITEAGTKLGLLAGGAAAVGAAGAAVDPNTLYPLSGSKTTVKAGFGAWLAKGGWIALTVGALVATFVAVGAFFLWNEWELPFHGRETVTEQEDDSLSSEELTEEEETAPLPKLEDFSDESILSLFSAEQGALSVNQDGDLVLEARWEEGDVNRSSLVFDPQKVMDALDQTPGRAHGAILIKAQRTKVMPTAPTVSLGTEDFGRLADQPAETAYRYADGSIAHEYFVIDTEYIASLQNGMTPLLYVEWIGMEDQQYGSEGRSLTVQEIAFYPDIWSAFFAVREHLDEDGVVQPTPNYYEGPNNTIFAHTSIRVPFFYPEPQGPNGEPIPSISAGVFAQSDVMTVAVLGEGFTKLGLGCLGSNEYLRAVYLPDSLTELTEDVFKSSPQLTRLRLGKNIRTIHNDAIPFDSLTDIDYDGTMEEWCQVKRVYTFQTNMEIVVHCSDGNLTYYAESIEDGKPSAPSDAFLYGTPMDLESGWTPLQVDARRLTLSDSHGIQQEIILRWALLGSVGQDSEEGAIAYRYYFDVLSPTDGSILYVASSEEMESYTRYQGASLLLAYDTKKTSNKTATLFLANYGYGKDGDTFHVRTTHFRLELTEEGVLTVNRDGSSKLNADITVAYPIDGYSNLNQTRQIFRDINTYISETYSFGDRNVRLLMVSRPHGDSILFHTLQEPIVDGFFFQRIWSISPEFFNETTLEDLYGSYGAYKELN